MTTPKERPAKAITLWQPWATLVARGLKQYETRGWATGYRGPLAIHAAKRKPRIDELNGEIVNAIGGIYRVEQLPLGVIVCIADLVDVVRAEESIPVRASWHPELEFGDFASGRFAWRLANIRVCNPPIPATGKQGIWNWQPEVQP